MITVGKLLREARISQGKTLSEVEKITKIRSKYLFALESQEWSSFPSKIYILGTIRSYAKHLDIDPEKALAYFRRDYEKKDELTFKKRLPQLSFLPETKKIIVGLVIVTSTLFFMYLGYQFKIYLTPPTVEIISPTKKIFRNTEQIKVMGKVQRDSVVTIFKDTIYPESDGTFSYTFPLKKGTNLLKIEVTGASGKKNSITESYLLE